MVCNFSVLTLGFVLQCIKKKALIRLDYSRVRLRIRLDKDSFR